MHEERDPIGVTTGGDVKAHNRKHDYWHHPSLCSSSLPGRHLALGAHTACDMGEAKSQMT